LNEEVIDIDNGKEHVILEVEVHHHGHESDEHGDQPTVTALEALEHSG
jgi:hypothetical protein